MPTVWAFSALKKSDIIDGYVVSKLGATYGMEHKLEDKKVTFKFY